MQSKYPRIDSRMRNVVFEDICKASRYVALHHRRFNIPREEGYRTQKSFNISPPPSSVHVAVAAASAPSHLIKDPRYERATLLLLLARYFAWWFCLPIQLASSVEWSRFFFLLVDWFLRVFAWVYLWMKDFFCFTEISQFLGSKFDVCRKHELEL